MLQPSTLKFLSALKKNNNKAWFDNHRDDYQAAKEDFANFVTAIIGKHAAADPSISELKAKDCLFRINRDIRFSKDKSPYKTNMGASINRGGKKAVTAGYYFHLEPGESFVGGGIYMPPAPEMKKIRQEIDYNFADFKKIVQSKKFKTLFGDLYSGDDMKLTIPPKGYEKTNPAVEYLKLKSWFGMAKLGDEDLTAKHLQKKTLEAFAAIQPVIEFINTGLTD
jgi:uncharacterized protein (TIGR02453 family)